MKILSSELESFKMKNNINNELKINFHKAKDLPNFTKVIGELELSEEDLSKYTSKLEECAREYTNCDKCPGLSKCVNEVKGCCFTPRVVDGKLNFSYAACDYQKKELKKYSYQSNIYFFDIPKELSRASMKDIYIDDKNRKAVILYLEKFISNYKKNIKGLYLYGNFGTGKTYLITAMFNELAKKGVKSAIIYYPEFLRTIKANFNMYEEIFSYIKKVELLLIDDIGAENMTAWSRDEVLGPLLQYRMQQELPTFFTSNLSIEDLEIHLSYTKENIDKIKARRIIERIKFITEYIE